MDTKHNLIDQLSSILKPHWAALPDEAKNSIKDVTARINDYLLTIDAAPLPEAPASAKFRAVHQATQAEVQFTLRGHTYHEVKTQINAALSDLVDTGWQTFDQYIDQRRAERGETKAAAQQPAQRQASPTSNDDGEYTCKALELLAMPKSENDTTLMWKIKTDKSKYPVPLYNDGGQFNEFFNFNFGISLANFVKDGQPAKFALSNLNALYTKSDKGYPRKITGFSLAA